MADYKKMYMILLHGIDEALKCTTILDNPMVAHLLKTALQDAEDVYIDTCGDEEEEA